MLVGAETRTIDESEAPDPTEKIRRAIFGGGSPPTGDSCFETRLSAIETRLSAVDHRVGLVETKLAVVDTRLAVVETKLGNLETGVSRVEGGLIKLQDNARTDFRLLFGALVATALGLAGMMAKGFHWF